MNTVDVLFSKIHSSAEKGYKSANVITFEAMVSDGTLWEVHTAL